MSLKLVDKALERKLKEVYPNTIMAPLSKAINEVVSLDNNVKKFENDDTENTNENNYIIKENENTDEIAHKGVPYTYEQGNGEYTGVVKLPMICFDRINNPFGTEWRSNDPSIRRGRRIGNSDVRERAFPVTPMYQIDIISDIRDEVDEIWREIVFYLYCSPNVEVVYSYEGEEFTEYYPIKLMDTDNVTDVEEFTNRGYIYRQSISIEVTNVQMIFRKRVPLINEIPIREVVLKEVENG